MKKWPLIIAAFVAFAVLAVVFYADGRIGEAVGYHYGHKSRISKLAHDLIRQRRSDAIIGSHQALNAKLDELGTSGSGPDGSSLFNVIVNKGDAPAPLGDGQGTHHFFIRRHPENQQLLGVRLQYQPAKNVYRVLGFWTPMH